MRPLKRAPRLPRPHPPPPSSAVELSGLLDFIELGLGGLRERGELSANDAQRLADSRVVIPSSRELTETMSTMIAELRTALESGVDAHAMLAALTLGQSLMHLTARLGALNRS